MKNFKNSGLPILILMIFAGLISCSTTKQVLYKSKNDSFQFRYPSEFQVSRESVSNTTRWSYAGVGEGTLLVKLKLNSVQPKTNLDEAVFTVGRDGSAKSLKSCLNQPRGGMIQHESVQKMG